MKIWKAKELINLIEIDGWFLARQKGSHKNYRHAIKTRNSDNPFIGKR